MCVLSSCSKSDPSSAQTVHLYSQLIESVGGVETTWFCWPQLTYYSLPCHDQSSWYAACDFAYQALPLFRTKLWKAGNGPGDEASMYIHTDYNAIILAKWVDSCSCPLKNIVGILHGFFATTKRVLVRVHTCTTIIILQKKMFFRSNSFLIHVYSCHYLEGKL